MYRNLENLGRGNPTSNSDSGSSQTGAIPASQGTSTSTTQNEQKFGASNSQFVPSLNAITSNQDLQWLVQPSFMAASGPSISPRPPYPPVFGVRPLSNYPTQSHLSRPGVIREAANSGGSTRRRNDEHLSPEELERRRIRRERNKQAAAKCRNRRRELTDTLQNETDHLEDDKARLQKEIAELQKEKEKLELVLEAHRPICKIEDTDSDSDPIAELPSMSSVGIKKEPGDRNHRGPLIKSKPVMDKPKPKINIPAKPVTSACVVPAEGESLHTPIVISTPSLTPFTASLIFTYPSGSLETNASVPSQTSLSSQQCASQQSRIPEPCSIAHRRSSSSGDQSDHSLNSPTIFTL